MMDFTFNEDQLLFAESVEKFLANEVTPERMRACWQDSSRDEALWQQLVELGLPAMLVPEAFGGLGMNELDFVLIAEACGKYALAEPLVEMAMVATPLLACLADHDPRCGSLLERIALGEARVAIKHRVNATILDADTADYLILPSGNEIHLVAKEQVTLERQHSVDPNRHLFTVDWQPSAETLIVNGDLGINAWNATLNRGALVNAAQMLGLSQGMIERSVQYSIDREQFGKPIGVNQSLKHHMANCAVAREFAKAPVYRAAYAVSVAPARADFAVSHAKVAAGKAATLAAKNSIQIHGAMGYTWECDLQIWMKRAWTLDKCWGDRGFHKNRVHEWLLNPKAVIGSENTFGRITFSVVAGQK